MNDDTRAAKEDCSTHGASASEPGGLVGGYDDRLSQIWWNGPEGRSVHRSCGGDESTTTQFAATLYMHPRDISLKVFR